MDRRSTAPSRHDPRAAGASDPALLAISDFCARYRLSRTSAYALLKQGELKAVKVGRGTRIRSTDAEAWASRLPAYRPGGGA